MQSAQPGNSHTIEVINGPRRNHDVHGNATIHCLVRYAVRHYFDIVITARLEIRFETTRNVVDPNFSVRALEEIRYLAAQRLRTVNGLTAKRNVSKEILPAFVNWHRDIDITAFGLKFVTRRVDYRIQKTLGNIEPLYQMRALLQICSHKGQPFFHARISLACRTHQVFEEFVRRLIRVSIEADLAQQETGTFVDVQTQAVARFNHVVHVHFRVTMLSIKHFKEKREIVGARRAQSKIFDRSDLLFESNAEVVFLERLLAAKFDDAGPLGALFLLLHDRPPRLLLLFRPHNINGTLRCDFKS